MEGSKSVSKQSVELANMMIKGMVSGVYGGEDGDSISRSDLIKRFREECWCSCGGCTHWREKTKSCGLIEDAPIV